MNLKLKLLQLNIYLYINRCNHNKNFKKLIQMKAQVVFYIAK